MRGQIGNAPLGQNQKTTVGNHPMQMLAAGFATPANPAVPRLQLPGRCAESQSAQPLSRPTGNQIAQLRSTQGSGTQVMILVHQIVPDPRAAAVGPVDPHQVDGLQRRQRLLDRLPFQPHRLGPNPARLLVGDRTATGGGQLNQAPAMQLQQSHPATDLLELAQGRPPIQPLADPPRQSRTRQTGLALDRLLNALQHFWTKFLPANPHAGSLKYRHPLCPAKNVAQEQLVQGGTVGGFPSPR